MFPNFEVRGSDSPLVERIWRSHNERAGSFTSISTTRWSLVISKWRGRIAISVHGPETGANCKDFPDEAELEWFGVDFKLGTFMPHIPPGSILNGNITLPEAASHSFWLGSSVWQFPNYENADTFVNRLMREELLMCSPIVNAINQGKSPTKSLRATQYRVLRSTGLSQRTIRQIERARYATTLLKKGISILDTVFEAGYSDQPHLTRSLKHFIGHTPFEIPTTQIIGLHTS
jgi:AraC-like DNA-binding protein